MTYVIEISDRSVLGGEVPQEFTSLYQGRHFAGRQAVNALLRAMVPRDPATYGRVVRARNGRGQTFGIVTGPSLPGWAALEPGLGEVVR